MLLAGTTDHLEDLDRQYSLAENVHVTAIAGAPRSATFVLLDGERIARVDEFEIGAVARVEGTPAQSLAVADGVLVVGFEGAHLATVDLVSGGMAAVDAFDAVDGRSAWENPAARLPDLRSIAVSSSGAWFVNVHVGGVWRSIDGGGSWTNVVAPEDDVHEVVAGADGRVSLAAAKGFATSSDDGDHWEWTTAGLHAAYCRAVAVDGDAAYVSASTGPTSTDGRLYRAREGGDFEQCAGGLPESFPFNLDTGCLTARAGQVAVGTPDGVVWRSDDAGETFTRVTERIGHVRALRFV